MWKKQTSIIRFRSAAMAKLRLWCIMFYMLLFIILACINSNSAWFVCWIVAMTLCQVSSLSVHPFKVFFCTLKCKKVIVVRQVLFWAATKVMSLSQHALLRPQVQNNSWHRWQNFVFWLAWVWDSAIRWITKATLHHKLFIVTWPLSSDTEVTLL